MEAIPFLYRVAEGVASSFTIPSYDFEDKVQECVFKVWRKLGDDITTAKYRYIKRIMYNHLYDLMRVRRKDIRWLPLGEGHLSTAERITIPLPVTENAQRITIAMINNKSSLQDSCKELGITYWTGVRYWRTAKGEIKQLMED